jgi:hypothetical protein
MNESGLSLQIEMNQTAFPVGGALSAEVRLVNTLNETLTPGINQSVDIGTLKQWAWNASVCGVKFTPVYDTFGFAVFNGTYTSQNFGGAGVPLLIGAPVGHSCFNFPFYPGGIQQIVFEPRSQLATVTYNGVQYARNMLLNVTTEECRTATYTVIGGTEIFNGTTSTYGHSVRLSYSCGDGSSLDGYWMMPSGQDGYAGINTRDNSTVLAGLQALYRNYFRPFPVGSYTIVAEDVWNQTVFAHFNVRSTSERGLFVQVIRDNSMQPVADMTVVAGPAPSKDDLALTPGGPTLKECVHEVGSGSTVLPNGTVIYPNGTRTTFPICPLKVYSTNNSGWVSIPEAAGQFYFFKVGGVAPTYTGYGIIELFQNKATYVTVSVPSGNYTVVP